MCRGQVVPVKREVSYRAFRNGITAPRPVGSKSEDQSALDEARRVGGAGDGAEGSAGRRYGRRGEEGVVAQVEGLGAELEPDLFVEREILRDREVQVVGGVDSQVVELRGEVAEVL